MAEKPSLCIVHTGLALPHILLGEGPDQAGGSEVCLSILIRGLRARGWPITIIVGDYGQPEEQTTHDGVRLIRSTRRDGGLPGLRFYTHTMPADVATVRSVDADQYLQMGIGWHTGMLANECNRRRRRFIFRR